MTPTESTRSKGCGPYLWPHGYRSKRGSGRRARRQDIRAGWFRPGRHSQRGVRPRHRYLARACSDPQGVDHAAAVSYDRIVYLIGGFSGNFRPVSTVWAYDPSKDTWTRKADLRPTAAPRGSLGAALVDGRIYAIGGVGLEGDVGTTEVYDPSADIWSAAHSRRCPPAGTTRPSPRCRVGSTSREAGWAASRGICQPTKYTTRPATFGPKLPLSQRPEAVSPPPKLTGGLRLRRRVPGRGFRGERTVRP